MQLTLIIGSGLLWTLTYVLITWRGLVDKTYGMPVVALAANISWEFSFGFFHPEGPVEGAVGIIWFLCDLGILYTFLRFGPREFPQLRKWQFHTMTAGVLVLGYLGVHMFSRQFDPRGGYAAFAQNLMMSALFVGMLLQRRSARGQSVWIALAKLVGTVMASAAITTYYDGYDSALMFYMFIAIGVLDTAYLLGLLALNRRAPAHGSPGARLLASTGNGRVPAGSG